MTDLLKSQNIKLVPTDDLDYIVSLAKEYKYFNLKDQDIKKILKEIGVKFWKAYKGEERLGCTFICHTTIYTFDAYKEPSLKSAGKSPVIVGKLVTDWALNNLCEEIWTAHDIRNRLATLVCKRIGFKPFKNMKAEHGTMILMRKGR
jgi:hypothetical protein